MTAVPKHIAETLDIELRCRITEMSYEHAAWQLMSDEGCTYTANTVILTPPVPQTLALLKRSENILDTHEIELLSGVTYEPCIAMMAAFDSPDFRFTGVILPQDSPISLIVDNSVKGVSETPGALTVHANSEFSQANYDSSDEVIENSFIDELAFIVKKPPIFTRIHRWRYSRVTKGLDRSHLLLHKPAPIGFAGDAFGTGDIEGAVLSGISVAEDLLRIIRD
jgi:predicted NAD/FAD-dependent oxidoreductase